MLPKIKHTTYTTYLHGLGRNVKFKKLTGLDYKVLLEAKDSKDDKIVANAIKHVANNCLVETDIDVNQLSFYDIEWLYLQIFIESVDEMSMAIYKYGEKEVKVNIPLREVQLKIVEKNSPIITINEDIYLELDEPKLGLMSLAEEDLIAACISRIFEGEESFDPTEASKEELTEFIESLETEHINKINQYFSNLPHLFYETKLDFGEGDIQDITFKSLFDFFM